MKPPKKVNCEKRIAMCGLCPHPHTCLVPFLAIDSLQEMRARSVTLYTSFDSN